MGIIVSITLQIINLVEKVKVDKKKDEIEAEKDKKEAIIKPIAPPQYYKTIEARRQNVKSGPYSVEGIVNSLKNDLIPVGYSLEQLSMIGFGANVTEFKKKRKEERDINRKNLIEGLEKIRDKLKSGLIDTNDLSQEDKELMKKYKILNDDQKEKYINMINNWIELAKNDTFSLKVLDNMIDFLNLKTGDINDALKQDAIRKQNIALVDDAVERRDKKVLESVQRALEHGFGINKF